MAKVASKNTNNVWGQDNPEKIRQHREETQLKKAGSILNPSDMLSSLFGATGKETQENIKPTKNEVLIYTFKERIETRIDKETSSEIKEVVQKLKEQVILLEKSEKMLTSDIAKIKVEQLPQKPGVYYLRFFEWLILVIAQLRVKVEEGRTWLTAMTSKKKKMGYWKMYKKHGTTFGLSNERTVSTQSG